MSNETQPGQQPEETTPTPPAPPTQTPQYAPPVPPLNDAPEAPAAPQYAAPQYQAPQPQAPAAPQAPSQANQYGAPPAPPQAPAAAYTQTQGSSQSTNVMAISALIFAFVFAPAGIVLGHIGLNQIKKTGEAGRGLALTGTILGYVFTGIGLLFLVFYVIVFAALFSGGYMY